MRPLKKRALRASWRLKPPVLALGGGGARGFAHLGVLQVLDEASLPVRAIVGTSMGAV
ncbi:MAG: patatin-like phospholipase family protein, partial [Acidobacteria bacterium]|nr:patatin-like phospholipase family protein [Acidobacteriota bacterium]